MRMNTGNMLQTSTNNHRHPLSGSHLVVGRKRLSLVRGQYNCLQCLCALVTHTISLLSVEVINVQNLKSNSANSIGDTVHPSNMEVVAIVNHCNGMMYNYVLYSSVRLCYKVERLRFILFPRYVITYYIMQHYEFLANVLTAYYYIINQDGPIKIAIRGGTDTPLGGTVIISRILEGGAAERYGRLNIGDQILVCDGVSLIEVTHNEAAQALKKAMDMDSVSYTVLCNNYRTAGNFRWVKYLVIFHGLIFVVCPEHVIIVAYSPRLLFECLDLRELIFSFGALRNENKTNENFLLYGIHLL